MSEASRRKPKARGGVEACEPRQLFSANPLVAPPQLAVEPLDLNQLATTQTASTSDAITGFDRVRNDYGFYGYGQTVAIIDSGIGYDHPALGGGLGSSYRVVGGWDFAENDANPYDDRPAGGHGTHVAGIVGGSDARALGVAPQVDLVALRVFDDQGSGSFTDIERALRWVHQHRNDYEFPITAVNMSLGGDWNGSAPPSWATLEDELAQLDADGIFVAVAAGNSFQKFGAPGLSYPAASSHVIPVASVDGDGNLSGFSQRAARAIAAPGRNVLSTVPDYLGNLNRRADDFGTMSGTSMASPYVAGASVVLREAMQFCDWAVVDDEVIYQVMYDTADVIYDAATRQTYHRLNLERALARVMPGDDHASTTAAAENLGVLGSQQLVTGTLAMRSDRDVFRFVADHSGTVTLATFALDQMQADWRIGGASASRVGDAIEFSVVAGSEYTIDLGTTAGLGRYTFSLALSAPMENLGVTFARQAAEQVDGEKWISLVAGRRGILTLEGTAAGAFDLAIFNSRHELLGNSGAANRQRLDVEVNNGETYFVRLVGDGTVDLRATNLVRAADGMLLVRGTDGDDRISLAGADRWLLDINGVHYSFARGAFRQIDLMGRDGNDRLELTGTAGDETAQLDGSGGTIEAADYHLSAGAFEQIAFHGGGGNDQAQLGGTAGGDLLRASPGEATLFGAGFTRAVDGIAQIRASGGGGGDRAALADSVGDDLFTTRDQTAQFTSLAGSVVLSGFAEVDVTATSGYDRAILNGTAAAEELFSLPSRTTLEAGAKSQSVTGFDVVRVFGGGGADFAHLERPQAGESLTQIGTRLELGGSQGWRYVYDFATIERDASLSSEAGLAGLAFEANEMAAADSAANRTVIGSKIGASTENPDLVGLAIETPVATGVLVLPGARLDLGGDVAGGATLASMLRLDREAADLIHGTRENSVEMLDEEIPAEAIAGLRETQRLRAALDRLHGA